MHNNIINYSGVISVRTAKESGRLYLRIWLPDLGSVCFTDQQSYLRVCKAAGGWSAKTLVYVQKDGWQDLQFRGSYDLEVRVRANASGTLFGSVITCVKQSAITAKVPDGVQTAKEEPELEAEPAPAPARNRRPAF